MHYDSMGEGSPVLLLHGWGCTGETLRSIALALAPTHRVVFLDFPGHGRSDMPPRPWTVGDYAALTKAFMEDQGIIGCDVVAHSFGARVTIKLASADSRCFRRIVITGGAGIRPKRGMGYYRRVYTYKLCKWLGKSKVACKLLSLIGVDVRKRLQNAGSADYRALPEQMRATFSNVVNEDLVKLLPAIKSPTLLLWGENDQETPLWMAQRMKQDIADSGLVTYQGAGHYAFLDCAAQVNAVIVHFLQSEGGKA